MIYYMYRNRMYCLGVLRFLIIEWPPQDFERETLKLIKVYKMAVSLSNQTSNFSVYLSSHLSFFKRVGSSNSC